MKIAIELALLLSAIAVTAADTGPIRSFTLDEHVVIEIPVARTNVTTVSFPGPPQAIDAANVTADPKVPGLFQLAYKPGNFFFSVRALAKDATANVNVVWNRRTYVLHLVESSRPFLSVFLEAPASPLTLPVNGLPLSPTQLLDALQTAKAYPLLRAQHPEALRDVTITRPGRVMDFTDFELKIDEAFRFEAEDTLVFRVVLKNKSSRELRYQPQSFVVRVGARVFFQAISDASGVMPPLSETTAYFAISGTADGGRNDLSLKNDFRVLLNRANETVTPAAHPIFP